MSLVVSPRGPSNDPAESRGSASARQENSAVLVAWHERQITHHLKFSPAQRTGRSVIPSASHLSSWRMRS